MPASRAKVTLNCLAEGEEFYSIFSVKVNRNASIEDLKETIYKRRPDLSDHSACLLDLYNVSIGAETDIEGLDLTGSKLFPLEIVENVLNGSPLDRATVLVKVRSAKRKEEEKEAAEKAVKFPKIMSIKSTHIDLNPIEAAHSCCETIPEDPDTYSNPEKCILLPYLGSSNALQIERMHLNNDRKFVYYGRSAFKELYQAATEMKPFGDQKYFLSGTLGAGKTHLLAALACLLTRKGKKIAYIPDCRALVKSPVYGLQYSLSFAFHENPEFLAEIAATKTLNEIYEWCLKVANRECIYFLLDQCNALDFEDQSDDRVQEQMKADLRIVLDKITENHLKISSATANYQYGLADSLRNVSERVFKVGQGLEMTEMLAWWGHEGKYLASVLSDDEKQDLERFTGGMPIILSIFQSLRRDTTDSSLNSEARENPAVTNSVIPGQLENLYESFWNTQEAKKLSQMIIRFIDDQSNRLATSTRLFEFKTALEACLIGEFLDSEALRLLDGRFFLACSDGTGSVTADFVRKVAGRSIRKIKGIEKLFSPSFTAKIALSTSNLSVLGYQVENMVLGHIGQYGCPIIAGGRFKGKMSQIHFFDGKRPKFYLEEGTALYVPKEYNYKAVDSILITRYRTLAPINIMKAGVIGIQITISESHEDTSKAWLSSVRDYPKLLQCEDVEYTFLWLLEKIKPAMLSTQDFERKERAGTLVWPKHTQKRMEIGTLNQEIAEKLRMARLG